jgi:hypothetical protein
MNLHGEIISWELASGTRMTHTALKAALATAGFDEKLARDMQPRNAFARACGDLADARIIRKLDEDEELLKFQFTKEQATGSGDVKRLAYDYEAVLVLNKRTGDVTCTDNPALGVKAAALVKAESETRKTCDISRILFRLFEANSDLFPVRSQGGVYFMPIRFQAFLTQIEKFLAEVPDACLRRFPVPAGYSDSCERSIKESVEMGLDRIIRDHVDAINEFDGKTRASTVEKMVERVNNTRFKVEAYADYLADKQAELLAKVAEAKTILKAKVMALAAAPAEAPAPEGELATA